MLLARRIQADWREETVTAANSQALWGESFGTATLGTATQPGTWLRLDVTELVRGWRDGRWPHYGIGVEAIALIAVTRRALCGCEVCVASERSIIATVSAQYQVDVGARAACCIAASAPAMSPRRCLSIAASTHDSELS